MFAGMASALAYLSVFFSFLFLAPVQASFERRGRAAGFWTAIAAFGAIVAGQFVRILLASRGLPGAGLLLAVAAPPAIFLGALVLVNAPFWARLDATYRLLAVGLLVSAIILPGYLSLAKEGELRGFVESRVEGALAPFKAELGAAEVGTGGGRSGASGAEAESMDYERSAALAGIDAKEIAAEALRLVASSFVAILCGLLALGYWLGTSMGRRGAFLAAAFAASNPGAEAPRPQAAPVGVLRSYRVPYGLLWPFLAAWAFVAATLLVAALEPLSPIAWNAALTLSLFYAAQGLGIVQHLLDRVRAPRFTRIMFGAGAIALVLTPGAGSLLAAAIPVLGVTEVWIPYRKSQGVTP